MPIHKIVATKRGKAAIAAALAAALAGGWGAYAPNPPAVAPVAIHHVAVSPSVTIRAAIDKDYVPPAVKLAVEYLIMPWEGLRTTAYLDRLPKHPVWTVCYGETLNVKKGMKFTPAECEAKLIQRVIFDYYLPLVDRVPGYPDAPISLQASMISGAYNYGVQRQIDSTTAERVGQHRYHDACIAQTAFNKAGGVRLDGLVHRRENGDAHRMGEAELCVSGL
ncbi:lysozyme [Mesorhizobium sp. M0050]|uniref:lysozyme n=1 Tax=Mesorhizobium sp. M0050 TaxID=2956861 RepID=UPI00333C21B4